MTRPATDYAIQRFYDQPYVDGRGKLCRWRPCSKPLRGRQMKWCSPECGGLAFATWNWGSARGAVFLRDQGICAACGLDCAHLQALLRWVHYKGDGEGWHERSVRFRAIRYELGLPLNYEAGNDIWEADHIVALVEGGKLCDLENLRTLCHWCHKIETRALATRRARQRLAKRNEGRLMLALFGGGG